MENFDFRTKLEKERDAMNALIIQDYKDIMRTRPDLPPFRVFTVLGAKYDRTSVTISRVLTDAGIYSPKKRAKKTANI